jgi:hypothetical protein
VRGWSARPKGDPLAGLAWLLHQSDHKCAPRDTQARAPPSEHGVAGQRSGSSNSEQRPDGQDRDNGPPRAEPRFYSDQKKSASLAVENGLREDTSEHPAVVPASLGRNDRLSVLPVAQPPTFLRTESVNRDGPDFKAAQIGETYGADHYSDDTPGPRWRGALMVVMAVLAFAIVGTVGALGYGVMFSSPWCHPWRALSGFWGPTASSRVMARRGRAKRALSRTKR